MNGIDVELGIDHIVSLVHVLDPTPSRRDGKQHGHQIVMVSKKLPLWRKYICHHQQNLSRLVCLCVFMFVTSVCAYLRVGGEQLGVCIIDFDVCVE